MQRKGKLRALASHYARSVSPPPQPAPAPHSQGCGAANWRRLVAVHCDRAASFETVHGLLNRLMEVLSVPYTGA